MATASTRFIFKGEMERNIRSKPSSATVIISRRCVRNQVKGFHVITNLPNLHNLLTTALKKDIHESVT